MRLGLALPHYDCSIAGENPLRHETLLAEAVAAEQWGYDSLWVSDHLTWDLAKYGADATRYGVYEALATLGALAVATSTIRLGTLVLCEALRPAGVLAKAIASLDCVSNGRIDLGLGAGWYAPDYEAIGTTLPRPGERIARLDEYLSIVVPMLHGDAPVTFDGVHHRVAGAVNDPRPVQPQLPVFVGGRGDRLLGMIARHGVGWNTCWAITPDAYRARLEVLDAACDRVGRDPSTLWRSLGLYALCGENEADLQRRFERLAERTPAGVLTGTTLDEWRVGRLVGTVEQVREQAAEWAELGVETIIVGNGAVPFQRCASDDVELLAHALGASR